MPRRDRYAPAVATYVLTSQGGIFHLRRLELMLRVKSALIGVLSAAMLVATQGAGLVRAQSAPQALVIGVDHIDLDNQRPDLGRVFEYTDFFSREASVHTGDT